MKLSGNKKNGRYVAGRRRDQTSPNGMSVNPKVPGTPVRRKGTLRAAKILFAVLAVILALLVTFYIYLKVGLQAPDVNEVPKPTSSSDAAVVSGAQTVPPSRDKTKITFVILGMDDGNGNTDTIMVATFDDTNYTLNVVSIPRDTLVNVSWPTKKANSLYANGGIESVNKGMTNLLGYEPDYYVKVDLDAFSKLVDGIGGVYFDVPKDMDYDDDVQDLHIHLKAGPQLLDGEHALQLVRARKNVWDTGDIGRVEMQQNFLKAAAGQILEKKDSIKISALIDIFVNDVDTDLKAEDLLWLGPEFFKMDAVNVSFETLPANYYDTVNGDSYCTIDVNQWLNVINKKLNPFDFEVEASDLSILTRGADGKLYVTDGNWAGKKSWGSGSSSVSSEPSSEPEPSSAQNDEPSPSDSPDISSSGDAPAGFSNDGSSDVSPIETEASAVTTSNEASETTPSPDVPSPDN